ncbi:CHASE3 domain-containing protein [Undibacterium sp. TJN19]|uniref:CHASE3 domain-containing protein n=1 Tax=Undibacterium sp. TJN19 TaxID=3413055 RepID=UPI003BF2C991
MKRLGTSSLPFYITFLFVACLIVLVGNAFSSYQNLERLKTNNEAAEHNWSVKDKLKNINVLIMDAESSIRGYFISGNPIYLRPWEAAKQQLQGDFKELERLLGDNPAQVKNLRELRALYDSKERVFENSIAIYQKVGLPDIVALAKAGEGREIMDEIRLLDIIMEKEENETLQTRRKLFYTEYKEALFIGNAINGLALLVLILFYRLIYHNSNKQRCTENALKIANDNLETTVLKRTEQLSVLSRHLLKVAEEEKAKLARELHDEMGSNLTAINMDISVVAEKLKEKEPALATQLQRTKRVLQDTVNLKRRIIEDLRPSMLDNLGLAASIQYYCEEATAIAGLDYATDIAEDFDTLDPARSIALFRIMQESLNNVIKYAQATKVKISLKRQESGLWLQILDDGIGIQKDAITKPKSHGLLGMRERALLLGGTFKVKPGEDNHGTAIEAFIPFN